jgi:hypothetical protein
LSWSDLQTEVREKPCLVIGHNWCGDRFKRPESNKHGGELETIGWQCLRCGETIGERDAPA